MKKNLKANIAVSTFHTVILSEYSPESIGKVLPISGNPDFAANSPIAWRHRYYDEST